MSKFQHSPGRVIVEDVFITKANGSGKQDITPITAEINIESSLMDVSTKVTVTISDGFAFLTEFQVESGDTIDMSIIWAEEPVKFNVTVLRVGPITNTESGRVYSLECVSTLFFNSLKTKFSRSVSGKPSEIAYDIYKEFTEEKVRYWEETINTVKYVLPYQRPTQALQFLAVKGKSSVDSSICYFYQDSRLRYNFASLEFIVESQKKNDVQQYVYNATTLNLNTKNQARNILSLTYNPISDFAFHTNAMANSSTLLSNDLTKKEYSVVTNNYWQDFSDGVHLNANPLHEEVEMDKTAQIKTKTYASSTQTDIEINTITDRSILNQSLTSSSHSIDINIHSNQVVEVGDVVEVLIPKPAPRNGEDDGVDPYWSGRYLVVAKREMLSNDEGTIALTLIKDSKK